jgi:hypothetical protein
MITDKNKDPNLKKKSKDGMDEQLTTQPIVNEQEQDEIANGEPESTNPEMPSSEETDEDKEQKTFSSENGSLTENDAKRDAGLNQ